MEIHELNTFGGTLGASDYFAIDNGSDTSKISASDLFGPLEERIDNIIAGPTSSAEEVVDARMGVNGTVYASLGSAIRTQVTDLMENLSETTRNIWQWGNDIEIVSASSKTIRNISLPAGTYTLSAFVTDSNNDPRNCRVEFYKDSIATANRLANPYIAAYSRKSATFTLADTANIAVFRYALSGSQSGTTTWKDVQIEAGSSATTYVTPLTAVDVVARADALVYDAMYGLIGTHTEGTIQLPITLPNSLKHPIVLCIDATYTQSNTNAYPYLTTSIFTDRNLERTSMRYKIGELNKYDLKSIRGIPYLWDNRTVYINVTIPTGCTLTIRNAYCYFERSKSNTIGGVQFHAHDGSCNVAPPQTLASFKMALEAGYNSAIVIPKVTSDGVWFAYHDDTFDVSSTILRNADGTRITSSQYDGLYFNEIPWSYLSQFIVADYGATFRDVGLMKLDDFFAFCAMTGMSPMFSMHPRYGVQTVSALTSLKELLNRYGVLNKLIMKMPLVSEGGGYTLSNFTTIFGVFGNDVARYEVDAINGMANPESVIDLFDGVSEDVTVPKTIEWWINQLFDDGTLVSKALARGYAVSCVASSYTDISGDTLSTPSSEAVKYLMNLGVTEFTEQNNTSNGLYW